MSGPGGAGGRAPAGGGAARRDAADADVGDADAALAGAGGGAGAGGADDDDVAGGDDGGEGGDGLTPKQHAALAALLSQPTVKRAAEACGVPERTVYRWLREDAAFRRAYRSARREAFGHAVSLAQQYAPAAVNALMKVVGDPASGHSARVAAAVNVLKFARESIELDELVERVESLEEAAKEQRDREGEGPGKGRAAWRG